MISRTLFLYVELVPSQKWPFITTGRTWRRFPKDVTAPVVKIELDVPNDLFTPVATAKVELPSRPTTTAKGDWSS